MPFSLLKGFLPNRPVPTRVLRGPFRGAVIVMNPRDSLRKIFGVYEHELNSWIEQALRRVNRVLDVGANDGYFTFGCAAAFHRLGKKGSIISFEPQPDMMLRETLKTQNSDNVKIEIVEKFVGRSTDQTMMVALDDVAVADKKNTLVKVDVEGAEIDVIAGAASWMDASNLFLIEVHQQPFLKVINDQFAARGHKLRQLDQRPLPLLGREKRSEVNYWLVSDLDAGR